MNGFLGVPFSDEVFSSVPGFGHAGTLARWAGGKNERPPFCSIFPRPQLARSTALRPTGASQRRTPTRVGPQNTQGVGMASHSNVDVDAVDPNGGAGNVVDLTEDELVELSLTEDE
jgi:hypothetical protein